MLLNEIYSTEENVSPEEIDQIANTEADRVMKMAQAFGQTISFEEAKRRAFKTIDNKVRDLSYKRAHDKIAAKRPSSPPAQPPQGADNGPQSETLPQWKINPDGWGND